MGCGRGGGGVQRGRKEKETVLFLMPLQPALTVI